MNKEFTGQAKQKNKKQLQPEWAFLQTENSEPERESETSAETSNTASSTGRACNATPESIDRGNCYLANELPRV